MRENSLPYLFVLLFLFIIILLFCIRYYLKHIKVKPDVLIGNGQTIGRRNDQEDYFSTLYTQNGVIAALADGMGGLSNGKDASNIAVNSYLYEFSKLSNLYPVEDFFKNASSICNRKILEKSKGVRTGTTLVCVVVAEGNLYWTSVGDSAIVLFRNGEFINLNRKHIFKSVLENQYLSGKISEQEMLYNSKRNMLTNYLGHEGFKEIEVGTEPIKLRAGDKVILCSDGVYNSLSEIEMERILSKKLKPFDAAEEIIDAIMQKNIANQDNATVVILEKDN